MGRHMKKWNDLSRSLPPLEPDGTLIAVIEMSQSSWLVAGIVPGVERQPLKKLAVEESALLKLLHRWREEAAKVGHRIKRIARCYERKSSSPAWTRLLVVQPAHRPKSACKGSKDRRRAQGSVVRGRRAKSERQRACASS